MFRRVERLSGFIFALRADVILGFVLSVTASSPSPLRHRFVDRRVYLDLLRQSAERSEIELIGYCLMSNHVHLIAIPNKANVLGLALKDAHGRYASYWNAMRCSSGHVW